MADHDVAAVDALSEGDRLVVELEGRLIGVFNVDGELYAFTNWCPHQSGPVCEGSVDGTMEINFDRETMEYAVRGKRQLVKEGEILRCPWHAWEFDVLTGECLHDESIQLISHPVRTEDGRIVISL